MFIELHKLDGSTITINLNKPEPITINLDKLEYFAPADHGKHTMISIPNYNGWLYVEESYKQVKELIEECQKK